MLVRFLVHLSLLSAVMIAYRDQSYHFSFIRSITIIPLLVIMMALLGVGFGLVVACLTVRYKDLNFVVAFGLQLTMYTTTVIYPLSSAPSQFKNLVQANPMTSVIETFRYALFDSSDFNPYQLVYGLLFGFLVFCVGFVVFNKVEKTFIDKI